MTSEILVALISGLCVAIPSVIATIKLNTKNAVLQQYKIEELTKKVEKHNSVVDRTYKLEKAVEVLDTVIKRIDKEN